MIATRLSDADFNRFQSLIYKESGIHLAESKRALLAGRLGKRLRALQIAEFPEYLRHVERSSDEMKRMLDVVTTNETRFFREQKQFDHLHAHVIPQWLADAEDGLRRREVRVWSAGCSTGEEPYSLAMMLMAGLGAAWDIRILATDLSTRVLDVATAGVWSIEKSAHIPEPYLKAFMLRGGGSQHGKMKAGPEIRSVIRFARLNLHDEAYGVDGPFDLILCRNVLIYFDAASRRGVIDRLIDHLAPGGSFLIGHAETLHGITTRVRSVVPTVYRKDDER
jgi:chemotaxis protein methyltransferase CheR